MIVIKIINNLAKLWRTVDDHLPLLPNKEVNSHNDFKRNISDIFKLANYIFKLNKRSFAKNNQQQQNNTFSFINFK
jgi:hypothetical protein